MLAELRTKSQITIPKSIVNSLKLSSGDKMEIFERDGMICIVPVVVYPKTYVKKLEAEVSSLKQALEDGSKTTFDDSDSMFASIES